MGGKRPRIKGPPVWSEPLLTALTEREDRETEVGRGGGKAKQLGTPSAGKPTPTPPARFHLSVVRELHTGAGSMTGASIDHTVAPAWLDLTGDGDAIVSIAGGCPVAQWKVSENTSADVSVLCGDEEEAPSSRKTNAVSLVVRVKRGANGQTRAFVLQFTKKEDGYTVQEIFTTENEKKEKKPRSCDEAGRGDVEPEKEKKKDVFEEKINPTSARAYFDYYASIAEQQNMLQDRVRTGTYFTAIMEHALESFKDKIVLDVGAGSGILSCFAALAGAKRVYAVEASGMATSCESLVRSDKRLAGVIKVIKGRVESDFVRREILDDLRRVGGVESTVDGDACVKNIDTLISEPMGTLLFNERMIESYLVARDIYLKHGGDMFPSKGRVHVSLYEDETLRREIAEKASFWNSNSSRDFYGVDLTCLGKKATAHYFAQPVVDAFAPGILVSNVPSTFEFDFLPGVSGVNHVDADDLKFISMPYQQTVTRNCTVHGVATWFDVEFSARGSGNSSSGNASGNSSVRKQSRSEGSSFKKSESSPSKTRWLTTAPGLPTTHWFQMRLPFQVPLVLKKGQPVTGKVELTGLPNQSYEVVSSLEEEETSVAFNGRKQQSQKTAKGTYNLKDPYYRQLLFPQPGYTTAQTKRWFGDETAEPDSGANGFRGVTR